MVGAFKQQQLVAGDARSLDFITMLLLPLHILIGE